MAGYFFPQWELPFFKFSFISPFDDVMISLTPWGFKKVLCMYDKMLIRFLKIDSMSAVAPEV